MSPLSDSDLHALLHLARQSLEECVRRHRLPEIESPPEALQERRGAFVTLRKVQRLRGCIGMVEACQPLYQTVVECAASAALHDPRFEPVAPQELSDLHIEISVLSALVDISPDQVEVGRHGLLVSQGSMRGVLLPQVPLEWDWDREQFLEETCQKAGLPKNAWRYGARMQAFTVQLVNESVDAALASLRAAGISND
ncbi:MAG TPA: AmmeMemoRadiSam system protein A [Terriglobia bacterium]|nr:AmmeMemoRadiSam system protein A [Terriglobia bacterium]